MPPKIKVDVNLAKLSPQTTEALVNDPLDDVEIRNALGSDAKIIPYHELKNYRTMDDLLPKPKDAAMLLYENSPMNGHWVCLTKNKGEISFFDPYGEVVDKQLQYSKYSQQRVEGGADQSLHQLLSTSKLPVFFNDYKYQRDGGDVNTCGRHTINFIRYNQRHGLDLEDYNEMMKKTQKETGMPYDELISKMVPIYLPNPSKGEGRGRPLNAPNKTCAEKFLECVKAKKFRKVRGKDERYDPEVKLPEFGVDSFQPHLGKLAALAITGKEDYKATQKLIAEVEKGSTPDEREKQKEITQEDLRRLKKVKPHRMKSAIKHKYNLARQMEVIGGDDLEAAIKRGIRRFQHHERPYKLKGRNKDGRIILEIEIETWVPNPKNYRTGGDYEGEEVDVLLPLMFVYQKFSHFTDTPTIYNPEDGADAGLLFMGKKKERRENPYYTSGFYEYDVDDPNNRDARIDYDWLKSEYKKQKAEAELSAKAAAAIAAKPKAKAAAAAAEAFDPDADYEATYYPQIRLWYVKDADRGIYYLPPSRFPHSAKERKIRVSEQELVEGDDTQYVGKLNDAKRFEVEPEMRKWWADYKKKNDIQLKK